MSARTQVRAITLALGVALALLVAVPFSYAQEASDSPIAIEDVAVSSTLDEAPAGESVSEPAIEPAVEDAVPADEAVEATSVSEEATPIVIEDVGTSTTLDETAADTPTADASIDGSTAESPSEALGSSTDAPLDTSATEISGEPTLSTDKADYAPGETATIWGKFFAALQNVVLTIVGVAQDGTTATSATWNAVADAAGSFTTHYTLPNFFVPLYLLAANSQTGALLAETSFTDTTQLHAVSVGTQDPNPVPQGSNATYTVTTSFSGSGTCTAQLSVSSGLPTNATAEFTTSNTVIRTSTGDVLRTLTIHSNTAASGTSVLTITATGTAGNCNGDSKTVTVPLVIAAAGPITVTANVTASDKVYDGNNAATITGCSLTGVVSPDVVTCSASSATFSDKNVGTGKTVTATGITLGGANASNYVLSATTAITVANITKANASCTVTGYNVTYDGSPHTATGSCTGVGSDGTLSDLNLTGTTHTNSADYPSDPWTFTDVTGNYNNTSGFVHDVIAKATPTATLAVTNSPQTYNGSGQSAAVGITTSSVPGVVASILTGGSATQTNAGTYAVTANFVPTDTTNYNSLLGLSAGNFVINKAGSTVAVDCTGTPFTYDAASHGCTASWASTSSDGGGAALSPSYSGRNATVYGPSATAPTNAGDYTASASFAGDANHTGNTGSGGFTIDKAPSVTVVTFEAEPYVYRGTAFTATANVTGVGGLNAPVSVIYSGDCTNVTVTDGCTATATYGGDSNHNDSSDSKSITITKAPSVTTVICTAGPFTYNGSAQTPCSATVTGVGGLNLTPDPVYTNNINAGTAIASYTYDGDANHTGSIDSKNFTIDKAPSVTTTVGDGPFTYDGTMHTGGSGTVTGAGGLSTSATSLTYSGNQVNAGTYYVTAHYAGDANHLASDGSAVGIVIDKANATVVVAPYTVTYDGNPHTATVTSITGVNGETGGTVGTVDVSNTTHTNAGTYSNDTWSFTGTANYNNIAATTITDKISPADPNCSSVTGYSVAYDSSPHTATGSCLGAKDETLAGLDLSGTTHTNAVAAHSDGWTFTDVTGNYNNTSGSVTDEIKKANATCTISGYTDTYDAAAHGASGSCTGVGSDGTLSGLNLGDTFTDVPGGTANWTFTDVTGNYNDGNDSVAIVINPATATIIVNGYTDVYDGVAHGATLVSATGVGGADLSSSVTLGGETFTNVLGGTATWSFANPNYVSQNGTAAIVINKADSTTIVTCPIQVTYTGSALTPCSAVVTGAGGLNQPLVVNYTDNTNVGTATASATYAGDVNHNGNSDSKTFAIIPYVLDKCYPPLTLSFKDFKKNSTIPVKCSYKDSITQLPITSATIKLFVDENNAVSSGSSNTGNLFRYSPTDAFWIFNLSTKQISTLGDHVLRINATGGSPGDKFYTIKVR